MDFWPQIPSTNAKIPRIPHPNSTRPKQRSEENKQRTTKPLKDPYPTIPIHKTEPSATLPTPRNHGAQAQENQWKSPKNKAWQKGRHEMPAPSHPSARKSWEFCFWWLLVTGHGIPFPYWWLLVTGHGMPVPYWWLLVTGHERPDPNWWLLVTGHEISDLRRDPGH